MRLVITEEELRISGEVGSGGGYSGSSWVLWGRQRIHVFSTIKN